MRDGFRNLSDGGGKNVVASLYGHGKYAFVQVDRSRVCTTMTLKSCAALGSFDCMGRRMRSRMVVASTVLTGLDGYGGRERRWSWEF